MKPGDRILICGGRDYEDAEAFEAIMGAFLGKHQWFEAVIEGGALGADRMARDWAMRHGICTITVLANWNKWGNSAGPIRNRQMLEKCNPDVVIAFPGGRGTKNMVEQAKHKGVEVIEIT